MRLSGLCPPEIPIKSIGCCYESSAHAGGVGQRRSACAIAATVGAGRALSQGLAVGEQELAREVGQRPAPLAAPTSQSGGAIPQILVMATEWVAARPARARAPVE
ncbi:hypothetical protein CBM2633_P60039 [Cupriavidus taiwanensis]|uniref:Uncharacterized protein n=3 Tax=Cupriavidus TaxID=106589 RepID=A0A375DB11_9BURK|nr:hypothetical protein pRALTA_0129 [Cupriavidus taiwanensis LMG 19424]SOY76859.1 hypothetical protein CBM2588_P70040 [Cupriavidus taiwanensis]SOZ40790.1 hypothetical protein CBM2605_P60040 [Cupriavidus neocaledonicus]SOY76956.1 hypothetical protein CBM2585_P70019 [Cupriavidus taiwanensis]SOY76998.1 hypothetical protein CBM2592_P90002 [Cupriavidus taiwanensis]